MIGPIIQTGDRPLRAFLNVEGGGDDFMFSSAPVTFSTFTISVSGIRSHSVDAVLYPGGGIEVYLGPIGLRPDVGDEIYSKADLTTTSASPLDPISASEGSGSPATSPSPKKVAAEVQHPPRSLHCFDAVKFSRPIDSAD